MSYTMYRPLNVWLDPASIADVVAHIQEYLTEYPLINQSDIEQIVVDYITAHPELMGGVDSVNGKTGEVVLTASDINTTNNTTIQAVINSLSADIADIVQSVTTLSGRVTTNETGITNESTARANADTALSDRITALQGAVGSPLVAVTATAMTDTSKIYVYTGSESGYTNGNWYYYDGSAWVSGGVYNATAINTDTTLTVAGMASDAKATGDGLNDLKSSFVQSTNLLNYKEIKDYGILSQYSDAVVPSTDYMITPYIEVEPNTEYLKSFSSTVAFYDKEKHWLSGTSGDSFTTPTNTAFVRCTIKAEYVSSGTFKVTIRKSTSPLEYAFYEDLRYPNPENDLFRDIRGTYQIATKSSSYPDGVERVSYLRHYRTLDNVMVREDHFAYTFESGILTLTTETRSLMKTAQTLVYKYYADGKVEVI